MGRQGRWDASDSQARLLFNNCTVDVPWGISQPKLSRAARWNIQVCFGVTARAKPPAALIGWTRTCQWISCAFLADTFAWIVTSSAILVQNLTLFGTIWDAHTSNILYDKRGTLASCNQGDTVAFAFDICHTCLVNEIFWFHSGQ